MKYRKVVLQIYSEKKLGRIATNAQEMFILNVCVTILDLIFMDNMSELVQGLSVHKIYVTRLH